MLKKETDSADEADFHFQWHSYLASGILIVFQITFPICLSGKQNSHAPLQISEERCHLVPEKAKNLKNTALNCTPDHYYQSEYKRLGTI